MRVDVILGATIFFSLLAIFIAVLDLRLIRQQRRERRDDDGV